MEYVHAVADNQDVWRKKTPHHVASEFYDVRAFINGQSTLTDVECTQVGSVENVRLLHLQCHFGLDTLSWARRGANVTGLDFSPESIEAAIKLSKECDIKALFRCGNVLDIQYDWTASFDRIVTSYGVLCWLPDLSEWAQNIARYLRPGGIFSLLEFHPITNLFTPDASPSGRYSWTERPVSRHRNGTYADRNAPIVYTEHVWGHGVGEIVSSLIDAGLTISSLQEHLSSPFPFHPDMVGKDKDWRLKGPAEDLPVLLSVVAKKI